MLRTLGSAMILAGALAGGAMAQAPDAGCALPEEPSSDPCRDRCGDHRARGQGSCLHEGTCSYPKRA